MGACECGHGQQDHIRRTGGCASCSDCAAYRPALAKLGREFSRSLGEAMLRLHPEAVKFNRTLGAGLIRLTERFYRRP